MHNRPRRSPPPMVVEFRNAMRECRQLYESAAEFCARNHPHLLDRSGEEFTSLMLDLHRGVLVKLFVDLGRADWQWATEEQWLAVSLVWHIWSRRVRRDEVREIIDHLLEHANLRWDSLLGPFVELAPLRSYAAELQALIMRIANIVAKVDGGLSELEVRQLEWLDLELNRVLHPVPLCDRPAPTRTPSGAAVQHLAQQAEQVRAECHLKPPKIPDRAASPKAREQLLAEALADLDVLIGLSTGKDEVRELANFLKVQEERLRLGLPPTPVSLHACFVGNPGTGKTTVARIVGRIYGAMGLLAKGHLVEADRSGLVAEYAGQTGPKTNKRIDEALDGVLFIDEAYSLVSEGREDAYGAEAVQTLLKRMEDDRHRLVVILAGYPELMDRLLESNPGLSSRFARKLVFPDYTAAELGRIFETMCRSHHYRLPGPTRVKLLLGFGHLVENRDEHFGNGRLARNVFETAIRRLANRIAGVAPLTHQLLVTLEPPDIAMDGVPEEACSDLEQVGRQVRADCPGCRTSLTFRPNLLGRKLQCRRCQHKFLADWGELT